MQLINNNNLTLVTKICAIKTTVTKWYKQSNISWHSCLSKNKIGKGSRHMHRQRNWTKYQQYADEMTVYKKRATYTVCPNRILWMKSTGSTLTTILAMSPRVLHRSNLVRERETDINYIVSSSNLKLNYKKEIMCYGRSSGSGNTGKR